MIDLVIQCLLLIPASPHNDELAGQPSFTEPVQKFQVQLNDPIHQSGQLTKLLVSHRDINGDISGYSMVVDSVVCLDVKCEVIPVTLYWDVMGNYRRYRLPDGGQLTKTDHVPFTPADYEKLHQILGNKHSLLKVISKDQIVEPSVAMKTGVDSVSYATPLSMQNAVMAGAAYTCYTLWHWAQGESVQVIRRLTAQSASSEQLLDLYLTGEMEKVVFALEQLEQRKAYSDEILDRIAEAIPSLDDAIDIPLYFLAKASAADHTPRVSNAVINTFGKLNKFQREKVLEFLIKNPLPMNDGFYDDLIQFSPDLESYYEVHLMLSLNEEYNSDSKKLHQFASAWLDNNNFLIARRAYWFLSKITLSPSQSVAIEAFRKKHAGRL